MKRRFWSIKTQLIFWCFLCFASPSWGVVLNTLYSVDIALPGTGTDPERGVLAEEALRQVLVRVSGSRKIVTEPAVTKALSTADKYVNQFSYHQHSPSDRYITVLFNEKLINQLVQSTHLSVWNKERPLTLVWLLLEGDPNPTWITAESEPSLTEDLSKVLSQRAIPYVLPLFDLADTEQVSEQDVITDNTVSLEQAAKRYQADIILLGRLKYQTNHWKGQWTLLRDGEKLTWHNQSQELSVVLDETADELGSKLTGRAVASTSETKDSSQKPVASSAPTVITVNVVGIASAEQYTKVLDYLRRTPAVEQVEVVQVTPEKTTFSLKVRNDWEVIKQGIANGQVLIESPSFDDGSRGVVTYKIAEAL